MKKIFLYTLSIMTCLMSYGQLPKTSFPFKDKSLSTEERTEDLINRMTLEEKIDLLAGYNDFYLHPCKRLGIPAFKMAEDVYKRQ